MSTPNLVSSVCRDILRAFRSQTWLWVTPTIAMTAAAVAYAAWRPETWKASQALVVRDEAIGNFSPQGRFGSSETMKTSQETILEVARSRIVVLESLRLLGPPPQRKEPLPWPTEAEIAEMQRQITVTAPKGAEFGSTEVIYLSVLGSTRKEAIRRVEVVCGQLETRLADLRNAKAASVIQDMQRTLGLALAELEQATQKLEAMEREVGSDLGELRMLNDLGSGDSHLRTALNQVKAELRHLQSAREANQKLRDLLAAAERNPGYLLSAPSRLLDSQPALRRLKEGLVEAQLRTSDLRGRMSDQHPAVVAAQGAEEEVRHKLRAELSSTLRSLEADMQVSEQQCRALERQQQDLQHRLDHLASLRARYNNLVDDVRQRTEIVKQARANLAEAQASQSAARSTSLLTRFQTPFAGERPQGPSRPMIAASGLLGGLLSGAGLVFLTLPVHGPRGRRWTDLLHFGRRASDRAAMLQATGAPMSQGRRATDAPVIARPPQQEQVPPVERRHGQGRRESDRPSS